MFSRRNIQARKRRELQRCIMSRTKGEQVDTT